MKIKLLTLLTILLLTVAARAEQTIYYQYVDLDRSVTYNYPGEVFELLKKGWKITNISTSTNGNFGRTLVIYILEREDVKK